LIAEDDRSRCGTVPKTEGVHEIPDRLTHAPDLRERTEIGGPVVRGPGDREDPLRRLLRQLDERERPLPLVLHVEPGTVALDEPHLAKEGAELVRHVLPLHASGLPGQFLHLLSVLGAEVGEEPRAHANRLSHVEDLILGADPPVDARPVLGRGADLLAE
jgi:hypothetical protein